MNFVIPPAAVLLQGQCCTHRDAECLLRLPAQGGLIPCWAHGPTVRAQSSSLCADHAILCRGCVWCKPRDDAPPFVQVKLQPSLLGHYLSDNSGNVGKASTLRRLLAELTCLRRQKRLKQHPACILEGDFAARAAPQLIQLSYRSELSSAFNEIWVHNISRHLPGDRGNATSSVTVQSALAIRPGKLRRKVQKRTAQRVESPVGQLAVAQCACWLFWYFNKPSRGSARG